MNAAPDKNSPDPFVGYFASIVLALVISNFMAAFMIGQLSELLKADISYAWQVNLAAGLFLGISALNPVGELIGRTSLRRAVIRFVVGFSIGLITQFAVFTPMAGEAMSRFLFLLIVAIALPLSIIISKIQAKLEELNLDLFARPRRVLEKVLGASDRLLFISFMALSFTGFWFFVSGPVQLMVVLGTVLAVLVIYVARREVHYDSLDDTERTNHEAWLALFPDETDDDEKFKLTDRLKVIIFTLVPGAVLFGGMTQLAVEFLTLVYPNLGIDLAKPVEAIQSLGIFTASGLAVILFGMAALLGFAIFSLRIVGLMKSWTEEHLRENYIYMIRLMYFRPIQKYWD